MCGVVADGIAAGYYGYEAGQSGMGDIFAWFVEHAVPPIYHEEAKRRGISLHKYPRRGSSQTKRWANMACWHWTGGMVTARRWSMSI